MRFPDLFKLSTRMFKARTSRTLLTILGMSVGISAILFLYSLGEGLSDALLKRITTADSLLTLDVNEVKSGIISLNKEAVEKITAIENVAEVSPSFEINSQAHLEDLSADIRVIGIKPSFVRLGGLKISSGEQLSDESPEKVIIAKSVAQVFGKNPEEMMGKEISFSFLIPKGESTEEGLQSNFEKIDSEKKYTVAGVMEDEENVIYVNSATLDYLKVEKYAKLKVKCADNESMAGIREKIEEMGFLVSSLSEVVDQAKQIFRYIKIVLTLFGVVALIVSAIGMFNTMTIALLERTEEIGIMKSIGASGRSISMMFIMESAIMGFLGGLFGVVLGLLGGEVFNFLINILASKLGGEAIDLFSTPLNFMLIIIVSGAVVGLLTGVVPARRASEIDPLDALRYK